MVDKLIRGRIIEVIIVLIMVGVTIPIWNTFEERVRTAEVKTLADYGITLNNQK